MPWANGRLSRAGGLRGSFGAKAARPGGGGERTRRNPEAVLDLHGPFAFIRRDRATDPYLSTIINSPAKAYLDAHGVACKFDGEDVLLHSKFAVIDSRVCVMGSHNWSAGSFFHYDDLSFAVEAESLAGQLIARFDSLWA